MLGIRVLHVITRLARGASERRLYDVIRAVPAEHVVAMGRDSHPVGIEDLLGLPGVSESDLVRCPDLDPFGRTPLGPARATATCWA